MAQGKILSFSFCSKWYAMGMGLLTLLYIGTVFGVYRFTKKKMEEYKRIGF